MQPNFIAIAVAALIPLITGFIWYNPKVLGTAWMKAAEVDEARLKKGNMLMIFGLTYLFSFFMGMILQFITIHQFGAVGMVGGDPSTANQSYADFMNDYGHAYRTFKHGALHSAMTGLLFIFPILAINAFFERKSWKYIWINAGYWFITVTLMGGIICAWE